MHIYSGFSTKPARMALKNRVFPHVEQVMTKRGITGPVAAMRPSLKERISMGVSSPVHSEFPHMGQAHSPPQCLSSHSTALVRSNFVLFCFAVSTMARSSVRHCVALLPQIVPAHHYSNLTREWFTKHRRCSAPPASPACGGRRRCLWLGRRTGFRLGLWRWRQRRGGRRRC